MTVRTLDDRGTAGLTTGLVAVYVVVMLWRIVPAQYEVVRPLAAGAFALLAVVTIVYGLFRVAVAGQGKGRLVGLTVGGLVLAVALGLGGAWVFSQWSATPVFSGSGELLGYAPSPADGGYDGQNYAPLEVEEQDAPGVPDAE